MLAAIEERIRRRMYARKLASTANKLTALMMDSYKRFWSKGFEFEGRSTRSDYWFAVLANFLVYILLLILSSIAASISEPLGGFFGLIYILYGFGQLIPSLSLSIRRVRDMGKGWQWIFINLIPIVGGIWFIILLCQPSIPIA
jgi:uncharacterized membrane protein YhaH (DUF805 family)